MFDKPLFKCKELCYFNKYYFDPGNKMTDQNMEHVPSSFTFFNQFDDPNFLQYLETYCTTIQKKQKQTIDKTKKIDFFMEAEEQIANDDQDVFNKNLSIPSINFFQFKETTLSFQQLRSDFNFKEEPKEIQKRLMETSKIEAENQLKTTGKDQYSASNSQNKRSNEHVILLKMSNEEKNQRLKLLTKEIDFVKKQVQELMEYFDLNVFLKNQHLKQKNLE